MRKLFGTDGVRGVANSELTAQLALSLGRAAAQELGGSKTHPLIVVGRDTRLSGDMLEAALVAGALSAGAKICKAGVIPTPGVAFLTTHLGAAAGAVISASHNAFTDNGIKFFGPDGYKLTDDHELSIEKRLEEAGPEGSLDVGSIESLSDASNAYVRHALESLEGVSLDGIKVVVDCANGAAFRTSPNALEQAGADVVAFNTQPNGTNINDGCGSTHPEAVAKEVLRVGADVGLAHDGDADRVIAVDADGNIVDGDAMIAVLAASMKTAGELAGNKVVATVMANLGFRKAMEQLGIDVVETKVGDRYVIEAMRGEGAVIGGEQSGHVIFARHSTTGDGLLTGLKLLAEMSKTGKSLKDLASIITRYPQVMLNLRVERRDQLEGSAEISAAIESASIRLGSEGRVVVRASGTEPVVRVMVEAADDVTAHDVATEIGAVVTEQLGGKP